MNRPNKKDYKVRDSIDFPNHYLWDSNAYYSDLEKYCDELEIMLSGSKCCIDALKMQNELNIEELKKLVKALNKACYFLEQKDLNWLEFYPTETNCIRNDKEWKDFLMNEVNNE